MLYIVQMSDFHFGAGEYTPEEEAAILSAMGDKILESVKEKSPELFLCLCGDFIDSSPRSAAVPVDQRFERAKELLETKLLKPLRKRCKVHLGLCPGNHDATHGPELEAFSASLLSRSITESYALHYDQDNVDLVFLNSADPADYRRGRIDYDQLEELLKGLSSDSAKYFFLHHTLLSMDKDDGSSVRNAPALIQLVDKYDIQAIFHGHTHGQYAVRIGRNGCPIVGVGAALARNYPNVNSQFNLIACDKGVLLRAETYEYHADLAMGEGRDGFISHPIGLSTDVNSYSGQNFSELYVRLNRDVAAREALYQVRLHVSSDFESFEKDVTEHFGVQRELEIMGRSFSYEELAQMWEAPHPDGNTLFFNHGMHFVTEKHGSGLEFLIRELTEKKTSSRAILSTVNTPQIAQVPSDGLLPSMMTLQFGFDREQTTLFVTMNLRALESSRFLKINACEILYLAGKIRERLPFQRISVSLHAFRVQRKEQFGCFLRAGLDTDKEMNSLSVKLSAFVYNPSKKRIQNTVNELVALLEDKQKRTETVIETGGLYGLLQAIDAVLPECSSRNRYKPGLLSIQSKTKELLTNLEQQKELRKKNSVPTSRLKPLEKKLPLLYTELINLFKELEKA